MMKSYSDTISDMINFGSTVVSALEETDQNNETPVKGPHVARDMNKKYEELPESIRMNHTLEDYLWMDDETRANLVERESNPDPENDLLD